MGLCQHVYRRGGVYWWRRRFTDSQMGGSRDVAVSLGVREPAKARVLALHLEREALVIGHVLEQRTMSHNEITSILVQTVAEYRWEVDEQVWTQLAEEQASQAAEENRITRLPVFYSDADWNKLLQRGLDDDRKAFGNVLCGLTEAEIAADQNLAWLKSNDLRGEKITREYYRRIADDDPALSADDRENLLVKGFSNAEIDVLAQLIKDFTAHRNEPAWPRGLREHELRSDLISDGIKPSILNIRNLRRARLHLRAELFDAFTQPQKIDSKELYQTLSDAGINGSPAKSQLRLRQPRAPDQIEDRDVVTTSQAQEQAAFAPETVPARTITDLVESLIKTKGKSFTEKTRNQHRLVGRLLIKLVAADNAARVRQHHIGEYAELLSKLPKNYGKSCHDKDRSLKDILARGAAAAAMGRTQLGLAPGAVNRHLTQLQTILKYFSAFGYRIPDLQETIKNLRVEDPEDEGDKRSAFTSEDNHKLFAGAPWMGCESAIERFLPGTAIIFDSLFWVPIIGKYSMARLGEICGLMVPDIDDTARTPSIEIRPNKVRTRLKNKAATRRIPIHPELIRLGFLDYVRQIRAAGFAELFPDLRMRGKKTPLSDLFYDVWVKVLREFLPNAREERKSFHSFRHQGNTQLTGPVQDSVRLRLMGHTAKDVNGIVYTKPLPDDVVLEAILKLEVVTAHIPTRLVSIRHLYKSRT